MDEGTGRTGGAELEVVEKAGSENDGGVVDVVVVVVSRAGALLDAEVEAGRAGRLRALPRAGRYWAAPETSSGRSPRLRVMVPSAPEAELGVRWKLCTWPPLAVTSTTPSSVAKRIRRSVSFVVTVPATDVVTPFKPSFGRGARRERSGLSEVATSSGSRCRAELGKRTLVWPGRWDCSATVTPLGKARACSRRMVGFSLALALASCLGPFAVLVMLARPKPPWCGPDGVKTRSKFGSRTVFVRPEAMASRKANSWQEVHIRKLSPIASAVVRAVGSAWYCPGGPPSLC